MDIIDIKEIIDYFKNKIGIIILITVLVAMAGCLYSYFVQTPLYKSSSTIVLISDNTSELTYNDISLNKNLVSTYTEIVKSKRILNTVIKNLDIDYNYSSLSSNIEVSSVSNTEIIKITVTDKDKYTAKNIADETAKVFAEEIPKLYSISNVNILDKSEVAVLPYNINIAKQIALFITIGLALGVIFVFVLYYFDRTIKTVEQIENKVGFPVLGTVQDFVKEAK